MPVPRPTPAQLRQVASDLHFHLSDADVDSFLALIDSAIGAYDRLAAVPDELPLVRYPRSPGVRPAAGENPYNAWYVQTAIRGARRGKLAGKRIVIKDNVCVAGVPMMNGASTLEGYVPDVDATIVTRILDAGGEIAGKAHCENFCLSGGSHTNSTGPVHNPRRRGYSAGGSSSGSAALVAAGEVDMAIGGDQGGSIRIPASYCGIVGLKPTHGLVPYSGVMPIEVTVDHVGPMTATVADNALLLEVVAGPDGLDPRQPDVRPARYTRALDRGVEGLRIGVLREGFGHHNSEPDVDAAVRAGADRLSHLGARVDQVGIPEHLFAPAVWTPIILEGLTALMMKGNGFGTNWQGLYVTSLMAAHAGWRARADELSESLKLSMLVGEFMSRQSGGRWYAKAQNVRRRIRAAYDAALAEHDLLLMPTLPLKATELPPDDAPREEVVARAFEMIPNTAPFDVTGHPAISIPCGERDGLPVGLMLVGRHFEEATIYRAAADFERAGAPA